MTIPCVIVAAVPKTAAKSRKRSEADDSSPAVASTGKRASHGSIASFEVDQVAVAKGSVVKVLPTKFKNLITVTQLRDSDWTTFSRDNAEVSLSWPLQPVLCCAFVPFLLFGAGGLKDHHLCQGDSKAWRLAGR